MPNRHHLIGIIALVLLLSAAAAWLWLPDDAGGWAASLHGACLRVGAVMGVLWLAYDDVRRIPPWFWPPLTALAVVLAVKPKLAIYAVPIIVALAILRPRFGRRKS